MPMHMRLMQCLGAEQRRSGLGNVEINSGPARLSGLSVTKLSDPLPGGQPSVAERRGLANPHGHYNGGCQWIHRHTPSPRHIDKLSPYASGDGQQPTTAEIEVAWTLAPCLARCCRKDRIKYSCASQDHCYPLAEHYNLLLFFVNQHDGQEVFPVRRQHQHCSRARHIRGQYTRRAPAIRCSSLWRSPGRGTGFPGRRD